MDGELSSTRFAARHAGAFAKLKEAIGLDYFGIDCGETRDGRLLVFEADVAMIVHDMDSENIFPYKKPAMRKLFKAFRKALVEIGRRNAAQAGDGGDPMRLRPGRLLRRICRSSRAFSSLSR